MSDPPVHWAEWLNFRNTRSTFNLNGGGETRGRCLKKTYAWAHCCELGQRNMHSITSHSRWSLGILLLSKSKGKKSDFLCKFFIVSEHMDKCSLITLAMDRSGKWDISVISLIFSNSTHLNWKCPQSIHPAKNMAKKTWHQSKIQQCQVCSSVRYVKETFMLNFIKPFTKGFHNLICLI